MRYLNNKLATSITAHFMTNWLEYASDADNDAPYKVKLKCAAILRAQDWECSVTDNGSPLTAFKVDEKGAKRTLSLDVAPLEYYEITVFRDNSPAPLVFSSPGELAVWLPQYLNEPAANQADVPGVSQSSPDGPPPPPSMDGGEFDAGGQFEPKPTAGMSSGGSDAA